MSEKQFDKQLRDAGWRLVRQTRHRLYACPCGHAMLTRSTSGSDHRALKNAIGDFNRITRACVQVSTKGTK